MSGKESLDSLRKLGKGIQNFSEGFLALGSGFEVVGMGILELPLSRFEVAQKIIGFITHLSSLALR